MCGLRPCDSPACTWSEAYRLKCYQAWVDGHIRRIAAMRSLEDRRRALGELPPSLRTKVEAGIKSIWAARSGADA